MLHKERCAIPVTWKAGDTVNVDRRTGTVHYIYTNGYTLIQFPDQDIEGGILNNSSTFGNEKIEVMS